MKQKKEESGITLIALVVTIVVLIILAMITINMVFSENGILKKAQDAADMHKRGEENEALDLQGMADQINSLTSGSSTSGVDMGKALEDFTKNPEGYVHPEQSDTNKDRAVGTDGQAVNMDLWTYTVINEERKEISLSGNYGSSTGSTAYLNENIIDGKIKGTVPQYIKIDGTNKIYTVVSMYGTFEECDNLIIAPVIPNTVIDVEKVFAYCYNLTTAPEIPNGVTNINLAFHWCSNLTGTIKINARNLTDAGAIPSNNSNPLIVQVPAESTTYNSFYAEYGSRSNITIQTF